MIVKTKFNGCLPDGRRIYFKGGGGGSAYYGNLNRLYEEQADSARLLRSQAEANLPAATNAYMNEVNQVTSDGYADQQASMAAADMASANAMERAATNRELTSMGVNPNDARFVGANRATEVNNAARMAAGKNIARNDANKYQLAVAQDAVGTFTGQSNSAAQQAGNASSGLQSLYNSKNSADQAAAAQTANNTASAVGGTLAIASLFKDGGKVCKPASGYGLKRVERHMLGGTAGAQQKTQQGFFQMQQVAPPVQMAQPQQQANPAQSGLQTYKNVSSIANAGKKMAGKYQASEAGAGMTPTEAKGAADAYRDAASSTGDKSAAKTYADMADKIESGNAGEWGVGAEQVGAPTSEAGVTPAAEVAGAGEGAAAAGSEAAAGAAGAEAGTAAAAGEAAGVAAGAEGAAATAVGDAALTTAATEAGATAATTAAAEGAAAGASAAAGGLGAAGAAIGAAMPWVGAAMAVGSLLELWADGGEVGSQQEAPMTDEEARSAFSRAFNNDQVNDLREGDKVPGRWTENKDTVPALLVPEEVVLNAEAAALAGDKQLEDLNREGLRLREEGITPHQIRQGYGLRRKQKEVA